MQWLGHCTSTAEGMGSIPGWELGSHAVWSSQKNPCKVKNQTLTVVDSAAASAAVTLLVLK